MTANEVCGCSASYRRESRTSPAWPTSSRPRTAAGRRERSSSASTPRAGRSSTTSSRSPPITRSTARSASGSSPGRRNSRRPPRRSRGPSGSTPDRGAPGLADARRGGRRLSRGVRRRADARRRRDRRPARGRPLGPFARRRADHPAPLPARARARRRGGDAGQVGRSARDLDDVDRPRAPDRAPASAGRHLVGRLAPGRLHRRDPDAHRRHRAHPHRASPRAGPTCSTASRPPTRPTSRSA